MSSFWEKLDGLDIEMKAALAAGDDAIIEDIKYRAIELYSNALTCYLDDQEQKNKGKKTGKTNTSQKQHEEIINFIRYVAYSYKGKPKKGGSNREKLIWLSDENLKDILIEVVLSFWSAYDPTKGTIKYYFDKERTLLRILDVMEEEIEQDNGPESIDEINVKDKRDRVAKAPMPRLENSFKTKDDSDDSPSDLHEVIGDPTAITPEQAYIEQENISRDYYELAQLLVHFYEDLDGKKRDGRTFNEKRREVYGLIYTYDLLLLQLFFENNRIPYFKHERDICDVANHEFLDFSSVEDWFKSINDVTITRIINCTLKKYIEVVPEEYAQTAIKIGKQDDPYPLDRVSPHLPIAGYMERGRKPCWKIADSDFSNYLTEYRGYMKGIKERKE